MCELPKEDKPSPEQKGLCSAPPTKPPGFLSTMPTCKPADLKLAGKELLRQVFARFRGVPFTGGAKDSAQKVPGTASPYPNKEDAQGGQDGGWEDRPA